MDNKKIRYRDKAISALISYIRDLTVISEKDHAVDSLIRKFQKLPDAIPREEIPAYVRILQPGLTTRQYREKCIELILKKPLSSFTPDEDNLLDDVLRTLAGQPPRPQNAPPYVGMFGELPEYRWTEAQYTSFFGRTPSQSQLEDLEVCWREMGSIEEWWLFLAQIAHESGCLKWLLELADGWAYEGRRDLGNTQPGDGPLFRGGGGLQLTGRANYRKLYEYTKDEKVMIGGAKYVAERYPFTSALVWWRANNMKARIAAGLDIYGVSKAVNGGWNGINDRIFYYEKAKKIFK